MVIETRHRILCLCGVKSKNPQKNGVLFIFTLQTIMLRSGRFSLNYAGQC